MDWTSLANQFWLMQDKHPEDAWKWAILDINLDKLLLT